MTEQTPGPWTFCERGDWDRAIVGPNGEFLFADPTASSAQSGSWPVSDASDEDFALAAAAPALKAACEKGYPLMPGRQER